MSQLFAQNLWQSQIPGDHILNNKFDGVGMMNNTNGIFLDYVPRIRVAILKGERERIINFNLFQSV